MLKHCVQYFACIILPQLIAGFYMYSSQAKIPIVVERERERIGKVLCVSMECGSTIKTSVNLRVDSRENMKVFYMINLEDMSSVMDLATVDNSICSCMIAFR